MTKIDGLEIVMTKHIKSEIDKELKKRFEELKPDIAKRYEELLNMRNMETDQFNDGFNDARAGKLETDHPHYDLDTDNWRLGYAWGMFEPMKEKLEALETIAEIQKMALDDAKELIRDFIIGFNADIFGVLPNGNSAFGIDEGDVRGNEYLRDLVKRAEVYNHTDIVHKMSTEPSNSDVSMTQDVLMDIKTQQSIEIEDLETVVEHLKNRLSEWQGVATQLAYELADANSQRFPVSWEDSSETSPAWIAYRNLVDIEDEEANYD